MSFPRPPLIARLRHRLTAVTWLFALLMVMKVAFATACLTDGAPAGGDLVIEAKSQVDSLASGESPGAGLGHCWHAGASGCHCSCAHGLAIPSIAAGVVEASTQSTDYRRGFTTPPSIAVDQELRPPIA